MPTVAQSELPKPKSWDEFEDIVWDLYARAWNDRHAQRYGRSGQAQQGVDIYGQPPHLGGGYAGVQCKRYEPGELTQPVIEAEISKAESFVPPLGEYTIATTHPRDATMQQIIRDINDECAKKGQFPVHVLFWEDICSRLSHPDNRDLLQKHYGDWLPADFVTRPALAAEECRELERTYLKRVAEECRYLYTEGVDRIRAELTDVFVMLEAVESPRPEERTDIAPVPERAEEMGLLERLTGRRERREEVKPDRAEPPPPPPPPVPLSKALAEHEHLVILGEPGTGKSTTLQFVAFCFAQEEQGWARQKLDLDEARVPVLIELRQYDGRERLDRFLVRWLDRQAYVPEMLAQRWLEEGQLAILLDGLDEVPQERRSDVVHALEGFAASAEGRACRIVVSSRIAGYQRPRELNGDFGHYTICPFAGPEDVLPYTAGWLQLCRGATDEEAKAEAQDLLEEIEGEAGLRQVRGNPLLLRLIVAIYAETGELARNRAEVYRRYVEEVIWQREEARKRPRWSRETVEGAVEAVAWALQIKSEQTEADLAQTVANEGVTDAHHVVRYLRERLGLLAVYGYEQGELLAFRHLTFREFFVARRLARAWTQTEFRGSTWCFLQPRLHHPAWREPLLLLAGMLEEVDASGLVERIRRARSPYEWELSRDLLLAVAAVGDGARVSEQMAAHLTDDLVRLYMDAETKRWQLLILPAGIWLLMMVTIYYLGLVPVYLIPLVTLTWWATWFLNTRIAILPNLQSMLSFPGRLSGRCSFTPMHEQAVHGLTRMPTSQRVRIVELLVQTLWDGNRSLRWRAVYALGKIGDAQAMEALIQALGSGDSDVRWAATGVLEEVGDPRAVEALVQALGDECSDMHWRAVDALGKIGDARAVEPLVGVLEHGDLDVRSTAAEALGEIGNARAVLPLIQALRDEYMYVRWEAAEALGKIGDTRAVEALVQALGDEDSSVRWRAAEALVKIGEAAVDPLIHALKHGEGRRRWEAADALGKIDDARAMEPLIQALKDGDSSVRYRAAGALGEIGNARAVGPLIQTLGDGDSHVRRRAARALGEIGDVRAVEPLIQALGDGESMVREKAAWALGEIGNVRTVEPLIQALGDGDSWVRREAAWALGKIGNSRAVEFLVQALRDEYYNVREAAVEALRDIGDVKALEALVQALEDGESNVRSKVAWVLGKLGDARAVLPLIQALRDEYKYVRQEVAQALGKIGDRRGVEPLIQALGNESWSDRRTAAEALGETGDSRAVKALVQALRDANWYVRPSVAQALGKASDARVVAPLARALRDWNGQVREAAAEALLTQVEHEKNATTLRSTARRLWWQLTDEENIASAAYEALERSVARFTELEALGDNPPLFATGPSRPRLSPASLAALGILIAVLSGLASNILAAYLQEQYALLTNPVRITIVVAVFLLTLGASIWLALRQQRTAEKEP